jgi:heme/copper-type cytochrome/quinol oxidase subunit 1
MNKPAFKNIGVELIWIISILIVSILCVTLFVGLDGISIRTFDVSISDTYFVVTRFHIILIFFILIGFSTYLAKSLIEKFKNKSSTLVFSVLAIFFCLIIGFILWKIP